MREIQRYCHPFTFTHVSCNPTTPLTTSILDRYIQLLKENREKGFRGQQQYYVPGVTGPAGDDTPTSYPVVQQALGAAGSDTRPGMTSGLGGDTRY